MNTSLLEQELAPLNARIEEVRGALGELEGELRAAEAELEGFSVDRLRYDAVREACDVLERLDRLEAGQLFWEGVPELKDRAGHRALLRSRIALFDEKINAILEKQAHVKAQVNRRLDELDCLYDDVHEAHSRDERREEEFAVEREISAVPDHPLIMPWSSDAESEQRYRRAMSTALSLSLLLIIVTRLVTVPEPVRPPVAEIPERLAMMVRKEYKKPAPVKKAKEEKKEEKKAETKEEGKQAAKAKEQPAQERPKATAEPVAAPAPKKAQNTGVLAFKDSFKDLLDETPVAKLGADARLSNPATHAAGQTQASRSLVTMQGGGGASGGIGGAAVSRNVGNGSSGIGSAGVSRNLGGGGRDRLGRADAGFAQVKSTIPGPGGKGAKPLSSGAGPARTDEEIQILFDRYKASLYRIYNTELRKDPTLRGKMVLRIAIEPSGAVSACAVESTNMNAAGFCEQIVDRVKKFNFGPKEGVPKTTILYPIDFLPSR